MLTRMDKLKWPKCDAVSAIIVLEFEYVMSKVEPALIDHINVRQFRVDINGVNSESRTYYAFLNK